jgi:hypothetical protein
LTTLAAQFILLMVEIYVLIGHRSIEIEILAREGAKKFPLFHRM